MNHNLSKYYHKPYLFGLNCHIFYVWQYFHLIFCSGNTFYLICNSFSEHISSMYSFYLMFSQYVLFTPHCHCTISLNSLNLRFFRGWHLLYTVLWIQSAGLSLQCMCFIFCFVFYSHFVVVWCEWKFVFYFSNNNKIYLQFVAKGASANWLMSYLNIEKCKKLHVSY